LDGGLAEKEASKMAQRDYAKYRADMVEYEAALYEYYRKKAEWDSMSDEEQAELHKIAEDGSIKRNAAGFFILATIAAGIAGMVTSVASSAEIEWANVFMFMAVPCIIGIALSQSPLWIAMGRIFRALFRGLLYSIVIGIIGFIFLYFFKWGTTYLVIGIISGVIGLVFGGILEITGNHHASGAPKEPNKPTLQTKSKSIFH
jgi:hypothetical protein